MVKMKKKVVGERFGSLVPQEQLEDRITEKGRRIPIFRCLCDCGRTHISSGYELDEFSRCIKCACEAVTKKCTKTNEAYLEELSVLHPNLHPLEKYINTNTKISHYCDICNYGTDGRWKVVPGSLLDGTGCPCCAGTVIGIAPEYKNSIWASQYKDYFSMFLTDEQMKTTQVGTHKKIAVSCPKCGREKNITPYNLLAGLGCICEDNMPFPEKFIYLFLQQTQTQFDYHKTFEWSKLGSKSQKTYDFYLPQYNAIIETHGNQHYVGYGTYQSVEQIQENDMFKKKLALNNGVAIYIVLDCRHSTVDFIKNSIIKSELYTLLDICNKDINWTECNQFATKNFVYDIAKDWNDGLTVGQIIDKTQLSIGAVRKYLKQAKELGLCEYNKQESIKRMGKRNSGERHHATRTVYCQEIKMVFYDGFATIARELHLDRAAIARSCSDSTRSKTAGIHPLTKQELHWMYLEEAIERRLITECEAEKYKQIDVFELLQQQFGTTNFAKPKNRPVIQLTIDGMYICEFCSISEAGRQIGVWSANISKCCQGELSQSGGFKWRYKDEYEKELNNENTVQND